MKKQKSIDEILQNYNPELYQALSKYRREIPPHFKLPPCVLFSNGQRHYICGATPFADGSQNYGITRADFERYGTEFLALVEPN